MRVPMEKRESERFRIGEVGLEIGGVCAVGRIYDISATGIRIEDASFKPELGDRIRVTFVLSLAEPGFEAEGTVTRHTDTGGFALEFAAVEARLRNLLLLLAERARDLPDL